MTPGLARGAVLLALGTGIACAIVGGGVALAERSAALVAGWSVQGIETAFTLAIFGALAAVGLVGARVARVPLGGGWRWAAVGVVIGVAGLAAALGDAALAGAVRVGGAGGSGPLLLAWGLAVVLVQGGSEELFFRGWMQPAIARDWGSVPAVAATALAFSLAHLAGGTRTPLSLVNLLLGGLVFGMLALRGGGIAAAVGAHVGWNAAEQLLFGIDPNPGVGSFGSVIDRDLAGPALWGGSAEGLNAALPMTFALAAILVPLALSLRTKAAVPIALSPAPSPARYPFDPAP